RRLGMGVDYSYSVGYGAKVPDDALKAWWERQGNDPKDFWPEGALERMEFPEGLGFDEVGNFMTGETTVLIVVSRLTNSFDIYEIGDTVHFFNDIEVEYDEDRLLRKFMLDTFGLTVTPGFYSA